MSPLSRSLPALALCLPFVILNPSVASDKNLELAINSGCLICHSVKHSDDKKELIHPIKLAPSYEEVAARYSKKEGAADYLIERVLNGTVEAKQNWKGEVNMRFMPPNVNVSKADASTIVNWILDIKNQPISPEVVAHESNIALAMKSGCMTCHAIDKNADHRYVPLAPAYREIAEKFANNKHAKELLLNSILHGTLDKKEHWKQVNMRFMPPNVGLSKEDANKLTDWILGLQKKAL